MRSARRLLLPLSLLIVLLTLVGCRRNSPPAAQQAPQLNALLPPLRADGWLNGQPPPQAATNSGQLMIIDCWAYWCGPCRATVPRLIDLYEQYADEGVVFLGLTADGVEALNEVRTHLAQLKIPWSSGYGAGETLRKIGVTSLPTRLLIDRDRRIRWQGADVDQLHGALKQALAEVSSLEGDRQYDGTRADLNDVPPEGE